MLNKYVFKIEKDNKTFLYNSLNKGIIQLPVPEKEVDKYLNNLEKEDLNYLKKNDFFNVTSLNKTPYETYLIYKEEVDNSSDFMSFVIHLNYTCNLVCSYCYQNDISNKISLTNESQNEIIKFILNKIKNENPKKVDITFIGGEPLLFEKNMFEIVDALDFYKKLINYTIVSNGTLLNKELSKKIKFKEFSHLLVTLDGPKSIHNQFRMTSEKEGTYDLIIKNIKEAEELGVKIIINYNLTETNYMYVKDLIYSLKEENIKSELIFSRVFDCFTNKKNKSFELKSEKVWLEAHKLAQNYGYKYEPFYRESYYSCGKYRRNTYYISPNAELYSCISGVNNKLFKLGLLNKEKQTSKKLDKGCKSCKFIVICGGGCTYKELVNGNKECNYILYNNEELERIKLSL